MNQRTLTIGAVLLAVVVVAFGVGIYLRHGGSNSGTGAVSGPGRAAEARGIIAEIEKRRASEPGKVPATEPAPIDRPAPAAGGSANAGANSGAETPAETPAASGAAPAATASAPKTASGGGDTELDAAYERARQLQRDGQLDDAQVLFFFGARQGHAPSAFAYAEMNDPNHHSAETSLLPDPDAFQAYRWYTAALDGGIQEAQARLDALHAWAEKAAADGDAKAERLLLQWEQ